MNPEPLDIEHWKTMFPIDDIRKQSPSDLRGYSITSPFHIAITEQIREECLPKGSMEGEVPTDIFVFAKGEPPRRDITKVGGLPYRPANKPWPTTREGHDMTFLAQFRFPESRDICPLSLPGDILLIFAKGNLPICNDPDAIRFEWYDTGLTDLVQPHGIPLPSWNVVKCYGIRYRTRDIDYEIRVFSEYQSCGQLNVLEGTKIGGIPIVSPPPPPEIEVPEEPDPGEFLCCLGSIECMSEWPYPWLNESSPYQINEITEDNSLYWGDMGVLNFYMQSDGQLNWDLFSY